MDNLDNLHWTAGLHHDGSALYVSNPLPTLGDTVTVMVRVPNNAPVRAIFTRTTPDGEIHLEAMHITHEDARAVYWTGTILVTMPVMNYRFKILTDDGAYWLNQLEAGRGEWPDMYDFKLLADYTGPGWLEDRIFYQIFPDRFNNGDPSNDPQDGAWSRRGFSVQRRAWGEPPLPWTESGSLDFFGGDLVGIQQKIDYLKSLGVNALYLTPIFISQSNHRYNMDDFYTVDPHLGGNEALTALTDALHANDMHLVLDMTTNHTGSTHTWFVEAQKNINAPSAEYYTFHDHPEDYERWLGVATLPKLNYTSQKLRDIMYRQPDSVLQYWLKPPYNVDGWRLDVYNMTARQGSHQLLEEVGKEMRQAIKTEHPNTYIFGEHFFDGTPYLQGDQLDAVMNYQGFNIPLWRWLAAYDSGVEWRPETAETTFMPSDVFADHLTRFRAAVPWVIARQQFHQLCSHDTTRILRIVHGNKALVKLGVTMLMAYPGVPCVYYGDEIGLDGGRDPDNRRTMPWDDSEWDTDLLEHYKRVIDLRKTAPALLHGGFQQLHAHGGLWVFQRQSTEQRLIVVGYRGPEALESVTFPVWHSGLYDHTTLTDLLSGATVTVEDGAVTLTGLQPGSAYIFEA